MVSDAVLSAGYLEERSGNWSEPGKKPSFLVSCFAFQRPMAMRPAGDQHFEAVFGDFAYS